MAINEYRDALRQMAEELREPAVTEQEERPAADPEMLSRYLLRYQVKQAVDRLGLASQEGEVAG